jgi:hypothetical protein
MTEWLRRNQYHLALISAVLYNSWALAIILNPTATFAGATVSELLVHNQPWSWLFNITELAAGVLAISGMGAIIAVAIRPNNRTLLKAGMIVLGLSTIIEVFVPLGCAPAIHSSCTAAAKIHAQNWQDGFHIYESLISYVIIFLLPLATFLESRSKARLHRLKQASLVLMAAMIIWAIETAWRYAAHAQSYGYEQRVFLILFTMWFLVTLHSSRALYQSTKY